MIQQMTRRERTLSLLVGGIAFLLLNLMLVKVFLKHHRALRDDRANNVSNLAAMQALLAERDLWAAREKFVTAAQPKLEDRHRASNALGEVIKDVAAKHNIVIEGRALGQDVKSAGEYTSAEFTFETVSKWKDLMGFLRDLQSPEKFIVFQHAELKTDANDKTKMRGKFTLAKWFAPTLVSQ